MHSNGAVALAGFFVSPCMSTSRTNYSFCLHLPFQCACAGVTKYSLANLVVWGDSNLACLLLCWPCKTNRTWEGGKYFFFLARPQVGWHLRNPSARQANKQLTSSHSHILKNNCAASQENKSSCVGLLVVFLAAAVGICIWEAVGWSFSLIPQQKEAFSVV